MHITKVELQNFKRFTNLTIDGIPADAKLVLLIGSNGSGKSSVFDAFEIANSRHKIPTFRTNNGIERRNNQELFGIDQRLLTYKKPNSSADYSTPAIRITSDKSTPFNSFNHSAYSSQIEDTSHINHFYGRTSFRYIPKLTTRQTDGSFVSERDTDRPLNFIDRDNRFENDIDRISGQILRELFKDNSTTRQIKETYVGAINKAFERIFGSASSNKLSLIEIFPSLEGKPAELNFSKGNSKIPYHFLSAGEKEVVNILLNLLVRKDQFTDTVYFFDEIDLHLNTQLQFNLLKEITENWIPENCQFWTASHSLGFIDYAHQYEKGVIIDFDDLDFDQPQTLFPQPKDRLDVYDIAVPKETLLTLMQGKKLVVCENKNDQYYNLLAIPNTLFVGVNNSRDVFLTVKRDLAYDSIRDRDFISDAEIEYLHKKYPNHHILSYYCFENYLYHPDNIAELNLNWFDYSVYTDAIRQLKNEQVDYILPSLISSRQRYEEFNNDPKLDYKDIKGIVDDFKSDEFERFYKFFSMKGQHEKIASALGKIPQKSLVKTVWFRQQIESILNH